MVVALNSFHEAVAGYVGHRDLEFAWSEPQSVGFWHHGGSHVRLRIGVLGPIYRFEEVRTARLMVWTFGAYRVEDFRTSI